jgi:flagellar biosynthesis GTPase FlhF
LNAVILSQRENPDTREVEVTAGVREEDLPKTRDSGPEEPALELPPQPAAQKEPKDSARGNLSGYPVPLEAETGGGFGKALQAEESAKTFSAPAQNPPKTAPKTAGSFSGSLETGESAAGANSASLKADDGKRPLESGKNPAKGAKNGEPVPSSPLSPKGNQGVLPARDLKPARTRAFAPQAGVNAYKQAGAPQYGGGSPLGVEREVAELRLEMEDRLLELKTMLLDLAHRQSLTEKWRERGDLVRLYRGLLKTGLSPEHARDFVEMAAESQEAWGGDLLDQLKQTVKPLVKCLSPSRTIPRLISVTGPTGAGKTTTLMRLAGFLKQRGKKTALISMDTVKLGAAEQLTQFARIMGLGLKISQSREEFMEARELFNSADHVLVDTSTRDFLKSSKRKDLTSALTETGAMNLLVLPASIKTEDLEEAFLAASGPFLFGLAVTKLDETRNLGNIFNFIRSHGPVFAYFSNGHKAPEDFFEAQPDRLIDLWLRPVLSSNEVLK